MWRKTIILLGLLADAVASDEALGSDAELGSGFEDWPAQPPVPPAQPAPSQPLLSPPAEEGISDWLLMTIIGVAGVAGVLCLTFALALCVLRAAGGGDGNRRREVEMQGGASARAHPGGGAPPGGSARGRSKTGLRI